MLMGKKLLGLLACGLLAGGILGGCGGGGDEAASPEGQGAQAADPAVVEGIMPLVDALCFSQGLHYDAFADEPDDVTTTYTLWHLVAYSDFRHKDEMSESMGAYYFDDGAESEDAAAGGFFYGPGDLYADYFTGGQFKYAPPEISFLIEGTQTGVAVNLSDAPYYVDTQILEALADGDNLYLKVQLARGSFGEDPPEELGVAQIVLTKNQRGLYGYTVTAFQPDYPEFPSIFLQ